MNISTIHENFQVKLNLSNYVRLQVCGNNHNHMLFSLQAHYWNFSWIMFTQKYF